MSSPSLPLPCLAYNRGEQSQDPVLFSVPEKKVMPCAMDELKGKTTWATPHGWFLVRDPTTAATFLCNPGNGDKIQLPPLPENVSNECTCLLSDNPTTVSGGSNKFVVMLLEDPDPALWYCHVGVEASDGDWARHEYDVGSQMLDEGQSMKLPITIAVTTCKGKVYFRTNFVELGVIEFTPAPVFSTITLSEEVAEPYGYAHHSQPFMVESKGDVYMVNLCYDGSFSKVVYEVGVYKMDFATKAWRRVYNLDGQAFLLSSLSFAASRSAKELGLEEDCVYVAYPWRKCVMGYNVRDGSIKVLDGAPESRRAWWMLPTDP